MPEKKAAINQTVDKRRRSGSASREGAGGGIASRGANLSRDYLEDVSGNIGAGYVPAPTLQEEVTTSDGSDVEDERRLQELREADCPKWALVQAQQTHRKDRTTKRSITRLRGDVERYKDSSAANFGALQTQVDSLAEKLARPIPLAGLGGPAASFASTASTAATSGFGGSDGGDDHPVLVFVGWQPWTKSELILADIKVLMGKMPLILELVDKAGPYAPGARRDTCMWKVRPGPGAVQRMWAVLTKWKAAAPATDAGRIIKCTKPASIMERKQFAIFKKYERAFLDFFQAGEPNCDQRTKQFFFGNVPAGRVRVGEDTPEWNMEMLTEMASGDRFDVAALDEKADEEDRKLKQSRS